MDVVQGCIKGKEDIRGKFVLMLDMQDEISVSRWPTQLYCSDL